MGDIFRTLVPGAFLLHFGGPMPYLSTILGTRIESSQGERIGRVADVVAIPGSKFPVIRGLEVDPGRGRHLQKFFIPWSNVVEWKGNRIIARPDGGEPGAGDIFLAKDLLDKQIVDMDGYKIVRVNDIRIARSGGELRVMGADVGGVAILRRLGLGRALKGIQGSGHVPERLIPWNLVSTIDPMPYDLRLRVPYRQFIDIHPSDIADIIEQLDEEQRSKIFALIEDPKAAEVLIHVLPDVRSSVAHAMDDERLSNLLEIMPPDEAADIVGSLPREKAEVLLSLMGIDEASVVQELLGYEPDTAGGRMTTEFISVPNRMSAEEIIEYLREVGSEAETIYYVYVVDSQGHLSGVLSLRELLRARPQEVASRLMTRDLITAEVNDDQELVADKFSKYNLLSLPVVDEDHVLKGIVTVDDAIDVMLEESSEDFSELSGVPFEEEGAPVRAALSPRRWGATILTFLGGVLATVLFGIFKSDFVSTIALVCFVPLALRASQDVSLWSLTAAVKDIKSEERGGERAWKVLAREYTYTILAAVLISIVCFTAGMLWTGVSSVAVAGGVGVFVGVALAGMLGLVAPLALRKARPDPAVGISGAVGVLVIAVSAVSFLLVSGLVVRALK